MDLKYSPFAPLGLFTLMACAMARRFSRRSSAGKEILPKGTCTIPCLSALNSTLPPLSSSTAWPALGETVPAFGLGMRPLGPSTRRLLLVRPTHDCHAHRVTRAPH